RGRYGADESLGKGDGWRCLPKPVLSDVPLLQVDWRRLTIRRDGTTVVLAEHADARVRDPWGNAIGLAEGMYLWLYQAAGSETGERDDLILEGRAHFDSGAGHWLAQ